MHFIKGAARKTARLVPMSLKPLTSQDYSKEGTRSLYTVQSLIASAPIPL